MAVLLVNAKKGKPFTFEPPTIEAGDFRFLPFVNAVKDLGGTGREVFTIFRLLKLLISVPGCYLIHPCL